MEGSNALIPGGYAKSWRKEIYSEVWLMPPIYHRVWYWIRMNTQYETYLFPTHERYGIWVLPGQRITSLQQIAEGIKWTEWGKEKLPNKRTIKSVLDWLVSREMVTAESNAKGTFVNVVNWHTYNERAAEKVTATGNAKYTRSAHKEEREEVKEVKKESKASCPNPQKPNSPDALRLSEVLADMISKNFPTDRSVNNGKRKVSIQSWAADIDKLMRIDGQEPVEVERVITWCQSDIFWKAIIRSGSKLRKQWDMLKARMTIEGSKSESSTYQDDLRIRADALRAENQKKYQEANKEPVRTVEEEADIAAVADAYFESMLQNACPTGDVNGR